VGPPDDGAPLLAALITAPPAARTALALEPVHAAGGAMSRCCALSLDADSTVAIASVPDEEGVQMDRGAELRAPCRVATAEVRGDIRPPESRSCHAAIPPAAEAALPAPSRAACCSLI